MEKHLNATESSSSTKEPLLPTQLSSNVSPASTTTNGPVKPQTGSRLRRFIIAAAYVVLSSQVLLFTSNGISMYRRFGFGFGYSRTNTNAEASCPQTDVLIPSKNAELWKSFGETIDSPEFGLRAVDWLAGAIKIP